MATDITIENVQARRPIAVAHFEHSSLPAICRAIAVVIDDEPAASAAIATASLAILDVWQHIGFDDEPGKILFVNTLRSCDLLTHERSVQVAHHVLGWSPSEVVGLLSVERVVVDATLGMGASYAECGDDLRERCASAAVATSVTVPDLAAVQHAQHQQRSRRRRAAVVVAILTVVLVGAIVAARTDPQAVAPEPVAPPVATAQPTAVVVSNETPTLVTTDGLGGFVGVLSPNRQDSRTSIFVRSDDGLRWFQVAQWTLDRHDFVTRLERHGDRYFAWVENGLTESARLRLAVSNDLITWQMLTIQPIAPQPFAMTFDYSIADVAINGADVLATVTVDIEIDFAALSLAESYTCGHEINDTSAIVKLCNGGTINVLSFSAATTLPPRAALYVSTDGGPFEPAQ